VTIEVTSINITTDVLTTTLNHGLAVNDQIRFLSDNANGLTEGQVYFVKTIPSQTDFTLSTSLGGSTLNITGVTGAVSLSFAVGPTDSLGVPYGYSISPLYVGDGVTVGGNPAGAAILGDLADVEIGVYGNVGQHGVAIANNQLLSYNDSTNQWENRSNVVVPGTLTVNSTSDLAGAYIDNVNIGITTDNTIDTVSGDLVLDAATNIVQIQSTLNVDSGVLVVRADTNRVGINNSAPNYALDVTGEANTTSNAYIGGAITVNGNQIKSNTDTAITLSGTDVAVAGKLTVTGNEIKSNTGDTAITLSENDVTITGDLVVNGDLTYLNVQDLQVEDKNIIIARGATTDAAADGGGITLKGATDKTITWVDATNEWTFNQNLYAQGTLRLDGDSIFVNADNTSVDSFIYFKDTNHYLKYEYLAQHFDFSHDLKTYGNLSSNNNLYLNANENAGQDSYIYAQRASVADAYIRWNETADRWELYDGDSTRKGQLLVHNGSEFVNTNEVSFTDNDNRPAFINDAGTSVHTVDFLKDTGAAVADADRVGFLMGHIDGTTKTYTHRQLSEYDSAGNHIFRVQVDPVGNFASSSTTAYSQLRLDDNQLAINGNEILFRLSSTGVAAADAGLKVERGTSGTDATFGWVESAGTWFSNYNLTSDGYIGTNGGEFYFNNDNGTAANAEISVKRGVGNNTVKILWNELDDVWQMTRNGTDYYRLPAQNLDPTDNPSFAGVTGGNIRVGVAGDNEIDTSSGGLTIDSAGGTTTIDDNVVVAGDFTHNGGNAYFNNEVRIGETAVDTFVINASSYFNVGIIVNNLEIATDADNRISSTTGGITLQPDSGTVNVTGSLDVSSSLEANSLNISSAAAQITMGANIGGDGVYRMGTIQPTTTTSTAPTDLLGASFAATAYRSMEFTLQATKGTDYQIVKGVAIHDGTNTWINTYSDIRTGASDLFGVNATIDGGNMKLQVVSTSATSTVYKGSWTAIAV
jgi:hypothetical protein